MRDPIADRVTFARRVLSVEPYPHQEAPLDSDAPFIVGAGGRRSGKTLAAQIAALHAAFVHRDGQVLVTSANFASAKRFVAETIELLRGSQLAYSAVVDDSQARIDFANGAAIIALPPTAGQLRGYGRNVRLVVIDEAGFCPPQLWRDARYVLLDNRAQAWLLGSPWGDGFFRESWQRGNDGDPDFFSFTWPTELNPRVPKDWIDRERARLNSIEAAAELDGIWVDAGTALFSRSLLDSATADFELPSLADIAGDARLLVGVDYGATFDRSAAVGIARLPVARWNKTHPSEFPATFIVCAVEVWAQGALLHSVVEDVAATKAAIAWISSETNGIGAMPTQELRSKLADVRSIDDEYAFNATTTSSASKALGYGAILNLLERGRLVLPRHPDLLRQLAGLRFEQGARGTTRIEADNATTHDDIADALMLATGITPGRDGRLRCRLARAALDPVPDADIQHADVEIVETGAGLRLPRRPWLQSIDGDEITALAKPTPAKAPELTPFERARERVQTLLNER